MSQGTLFLFGVVISFIVFTGAIIYGMFSFSAWHENGANTGSKDA